MSHSMTRSPRESFDDPRRDPAGPHFDKRAAQPGLAPSTPLLPYPWPCSRSWVCCLNCGRRRASCCSHAPAMSPIDMTGSKLHGMSPNGLFVLNNEGHTFGRPATRPGGEHAHLVIAHPYRLLGRHAGIELAISHELSIEVHTAKNDDGVGREVLALHLDPHVVSLLDDPRSEVRDHRRLRVEMLRSLAEDMKWRVVALMESYVLQDPTLYHLRDQLRVVDV